MRARARTLVYAAVLLLLPHHVSAQDLRRGWVLQVIPKAGMFFPGGDLGSFGERDDPTRTRLSGKLGYGLAVEFAARQSPFNWRASVDYVSGSDITRRKVGTGGQASVLMTAVGGTMRSYIRTPESVHLYFIGGVGIKRYSFTPGTENVPQLSGNTIDPTIQVGLGINIVSSRRIWVSLEASDYLSWYDPENKNISVAGKMQNDLNLHAGLRFRL